MSDHSLITLLSRYDERTLTREAYALAIATLYSHTPSLDRVCDDIANGHVEIPNLIGLPPGDRPSAKTLRAWWEHWRAQALRSGIPDLRVQILSALNMPADDLSNAVTLDHLRATIKPGRR